ncbi:MAG TPA: peptidoglycan-associated lipoprotein Pal [Rhizomicrobium sp.]|jgi:peptidoglycan-associated lipoprotein
MTMFSKGLKFTALAAAIALSACTSKPQATADSGPPASMSNNGPSSVSQSNVVPGSAEDLRVNVGDTVHFEYDKYAVQETDRSLLQRQAAWLSKYPAVRVTIEGHCDERGTREYNLALGARRANAVKEYLVSLGVSANRVDTVSYGKERPMCSESSEDCYSQNRRGVTTVSGGGASS